ncbi:MAG TPA: hypothetical protein PKA05_08655 [Roseiflexaceae bacterium]|nr:hypothetical protein [Roseiflexaceae bacterium]
MRVIQHWSCVVLLTLAACGAATPAPEPAPMVSATAPVAAPTIAPEPVAAPTIAPEPVAAPTITPEPVVSAPLFRGLVQSMTDEGFPVLGDPAAAVTITDYSDFF